MENQYLLLTKEKISLELLRELLSL